MFEIFKDKEILITGHTGFKGSWLMIWLNMLGAKITGYALEPRTEHDNFVISGVEKHIRDIRGDIRFFLELNDKLKGCEPEIIFHLAAQPLVLDSYSNPLYTYETNVLGTANILEYFRQIESARVLIVVTSDKCYENREWLWGYREDDALGGHDPYSASKAAAEIITTGYRNSFFQNGKKMVATLRAGNVIGGGDWADHRIIPDCIRALEKKQPILVRNPKSTRPWQHVLEPLSGYLLLATKLLKGDKSLAGAWNFGPERNNNIAVAELVQKVIGCYGIGTWESAGEMEAAHEAGLLALDISKAWHRLGWRPVLDIDRTIDWTVKWYRKYPSANMLKFCEQQIQDYLEQWTSLKEN